MTKKDEPFAFSIEQARAFEVAAQEAGWTHKDFDCLMNTPGEFKAILAVLRGQSEIRPIARVIDTDADPWVPGGLVIEEHRKSGLLDLDRVDLKLVLIESQKDRLVGGCEVREGLKSRSMLNATVLDYFLCHPRLVPETWRHEAVFFWGTVYRDAFQRFCVRYLFLDGDRARTDFYHQDRSWYPTDPAVVMELKS